MLTRNRKTLRLFDPSNDFDTNSRTYVPEIWAQESLMILEEELVAGNMVHRDFENEIAEFGDTVNTRRPGKFTATRKADTDDVRVQPATAEKVAVVLNQHIETSFVIKDKQASLSFKNLVNEFLLPAVRSIARQIDSSVLSQRYQFIGNGIGKLGAGISKTEIIGLQKKMDDLLIPEVGRWGVVGNDGKQQILTEQQFTDADKFGDGGRAIREGSIGRLYGTNFIHSNNLKPTATGNTVVTGAINNAGGHAAGTTAITVDGITGALTTGSWLTVAGDMTPQRITAHSETAGNTTGITISPGLRSAVADNAVLTVYTPAAINNASGYAAGFVKEITIDGTAVAIQPQAMVSAGSVVYGALDLPPDTSGNAQSRLTTLLPDRPLEAAAADNDVIGIGPAGNYNWGFHKNAVALVTRPLAMTGAGFGAKQFVASFNGLSIRVSMQYEQRKQGLLVTVDTLFGVKVLDSNLGVVLFS